MCQEPKKKKKNLNSYKKKKVTECYENGHEKEINPTWAHNWV